MHVIVFLLILNDCQFSLCSVQLFSFFFPKDSWVHYLRKYFQGRLTTFRLFSSIVDVHVYVDKLHLCQIVRIINMILRYDYWLLLLLIIACLLGEKPDSHNILKPLSVTRKIPIPQQNQNSTLYIVAQKYFYLLNLKKIPTNFRRQ